MQPCPFCKLDAKRILRQSHHAMVIRDGFPVTEGHTLIIPRRHVNSFFELTDDERVDIFLSLNGAKEDLDDELNPDGYNIGINEGAAAGQTVSHLHIHLIPRYSGDLPDPRGGVRWVIPQNADYWSDREDTAS
jgi:diadenosine tetraphosphate (Ap4A) HIT family hydrolase